MESRRGRPRDIRTLPSRGRTPFVGRDHELAALTERLDAAGRGGGGGALIAGEPGIGPGTERYRLFESVSDFLLGIASTSESRGLLLCLDDLHWADRSTLL